MRLIDADEVIERINDRYCDGCDHRNYVRCGACETDDCLSEIEESAEIDAIPVEWLEERVYDMKRAPLYRRYAEMLLMEWLQEQKEQEEQA